MANDDPDQRRDALLIEVMKTPPESRDEFKARLKRERALALALAVPTKPHKTPESPKSKGPSVAPNQDGNDGNDHGDSRSR
ncbi:MAG: hypothetical protein ACHP84_02975 [Caulobacterales bacterium]